MFTEPVYHLKRSFGCRLLAATLVIIGSACTAYAFDTGHHFDLVAESMRHEGFDGTPIQIAQVENWLVDYYSSSPTSSSSMARYASRLHFDNLFTTSRIRDYWGRLAFNTREEA